MEQEVQPDELFEDPDFPPEDSSLFSDYTTPIARLQGDVTWRRPQEISQCPKLFPENPRDGHAKQGILGDCWFLCACTILLKNRHLMNKVLPVDQPQWGERGYRGSFLLRFWQRGHWVDVRVDDRLPCLGVSLCFSRCQSPSVFWVALLEKAYAKLLGSYERLWAGQVAEALVDLTGGLAERWSLRDSGEEEDKGVEGDRAKRKLDLDLLKGVKELCAMSCSVNSASRGGGERGQPHALGVMEWLHVETAARGRLRLLRIRNPWGRRCWGGHWRESGEGWSSLDQATALGLVSRAEDGEFWVDEAEFLEEFDEVTVGYPLTETGHLQSVYTGKALPHSHQIAGHWIKGHSAGGCRNNSSFGSNPKFWLRVLEPGEVLVSLLQHPSWGRTAHSVGGPPGGSTETHLRYQAIGLHMWKVERKRVNLASTLSEPPCSSTHCHAYEREVVLHAHLGAGFYLLVPSTFLQGAEVSFLLRVFSSSPSSLSALKVPEPLRPLLTDGEWETKCFQGTWISGSSAGGSRNFRSHGQNPHIPLSVSDESGGPNVRIALRQNCPNTVLQPIGFHVYKVPVGDGKPPLITGDQDPVASCVPHCYTPEVSQTCSLPPGAYVIIPSTYQPEHQGHFTLTVAQKIPRRVLKIQENLGRAICEVSHVSVMPS